MTEMLLQLQSGKQVRIAGCSIKDQGILLTRHKFFSKEATWRGWDAVTVSTIPGAFRVQDTNDTSVYVSLSYIEVPNVHVLENAIRMAFSRGVPRLSDLLN